MSESEIAEAIETAAEADLAEAEANEHVASAIETVAEVEAETRGEMVDAAVEIAEINAERDVTIEAIRAEAGLESARLFAEVQARDTELLQCRTKIAELEAKVLELTPPTSAEPPPSLEEPPPSPAAIETESPTDHASPSQMQEPAEEPPKPVKRHHRWI